jgi:hypothetical protein
MAQIEVLALEEPCVLGVGSPSAPETLASTKASWGAVGLLLWQVASVQTPESGRLKRSLLGNPRSQAADGIDTPPYAGRAALRMAPILALGPNELHHYRSHGVLDASAQALSTHTGTMPPLTLASASA